MMIDDINQPSFYELTDAYGKQGLITARLNRNPLSMITSIPIFQAFPLLGIGINTLYRESYRYVHE